MGKVFKNGNSLAVTVPKAYAHQLSIKSGSEIEWEERGQELLLKPKKSIKVRGVDQEFVKMVDEFIKDHEDVLKELAHR